MYLKNKLKPLLKDADDNDKDESMNEENKDAGGKENDYETGSEMSESIEVENIFVPEGWETHEELTKRVSGFLKEFLGQCPESSHTLLASHGGTIRCLLDLLQATGKVDGLQPFQDLPTDKKRPKNTAITSINLTVDKKTLDIQQGLVTRWY